MKRMAISVCCGATIKNRNSLLINRREKFSSVIAIVTIYEIPEISDISRKR